MGVDISYPKKKIFFLKQKPIQRIREANEELMSPSMTSPSSFLISGIDKPSITALTSFIHVRPLTQHLHHSFLPITLSRYCSIHSWVSSPHYLHTNSSPSSPSIFLQPCTLDPVSVWSRPDHHWFVWPNDTHTPSGSPACTPSTGVEHTYVISVPEHVFMG